MRLTEHQRIIIRQTVSRIVGTDARVILFGSRLDDCARGGDLDLLVESNELPTLMQRSRINLGIYPSSEDFTQEFSGIVGGLKE